MYHCFVNHFTSLLPKYCYSISRYLAHTHSLIARVKADKLTLIHESSAICNRKAKAEKKSETDVNYVIC